MRCLFLDGTNMANTKNKKTPKFGTPAWDTHMRRSLAQRKRYGEKITDIEGLIGYIKAKGPSTKKK